MARKNISSKNAANKEAKDESSGKNLVATHANPVNCHLHFGEFHKRTRWNTRRHFVGNHLWRSIHYPSVPKKA